MSLPRGVSFNLQGENAPLVARQIAKLARTFQTLRRGEKATGNSLVMDQGQLKVFFLELGQLVTEFHFYFLLEEWVFYIRISNIGRVKDILTHLNKWCAGNDEREIIFTW